ncbi:reductase [Cryobacterium roopkundense]|nr:NAD-dependent epimerase/dehydratase family protein [Cryobacterium roopkundense]KGJ82399.1 reductase [Cryobacterium roopkundense]
MPLRGSPRRVLVLGGTAWLGHEIARQLVSRGDEVTCLARGTSGGVPAGANFVAADRMSPTAYEAVRFRDWDEVIELSYDLSSVGPAIHALAERTTHWTLVSSVSVYASNAEPGADETSELVAPVDLSDYAQAKVAAERRTLGALGDRLLVVRPGLIAGPGDGSDRFGYWVARLALAGSGTVLTPECADRSVQVIDVRDLASWLISAGAEGVVGVVNAVGDVHGLSETLTLAAEVAQFEGRLVAAADDWLRTQGVNYWAGPHSLPLWLPHSDAAFSQRSNSAFVAAGGTLRGLRETLVDVWEDETARGLDRGRRAGLTRSEELELLNQLAASAP